MKLFELILEDLSVLSLEVDNIGLVGDIWMYFNTSISIILWSIIKYFNIWVKNSQAEEEHLEVEEAVGELPGEAEVEEVPPEVHPKPLLCLTLDWQECSLPRGSRRPW